MPLQSQELLEFLYRAPIALVTASVDGSIHEITPLACQWLMPLSRDGRMDNLFDLLEEKVPQLRGMVNNLTSDVICENVIFKVEQPYSISRYISVTVNAFTAGYIAAIFADISHERNARLIAESATQFKANFLANMSHEIRTPLNVILNMGYLIQKEGVSDSQSQKISQLNNASRHLLTVISDILDLSKISAGKLELESIPLHAEELISDVMVMLVERANAKGLDIVVDKVPMPVDLQGDPTRIKQILINFVSNSIKFTSAGKITIRAKVIEEDDSSALLYFEVEDTGIGIEPSALDKIFTSFEQAESSTTRQYGGSGLGLAISKELAQLMGGEIGVRSEVGRGSAFWFTSKLLKSQRTGDHAELSPERLEDVIRDIRSKYGGARVLVAEDEPINSEITRILLEDVGFLVSSARDGLEALELVRKFSFQLILMDAQMPRLNGLDASRAIKKMPAYLDTPIIAITASPFLDDRNRCRDAGMQWFLGKPMFPEALYSTILEALQ